jgi:hypothetical protein
MMKFTRPITREIELGGERLAVTMGDQGVSFRPVGSRKPPREVAWATILCCATGQHSSSDMAGECISEALQALKSTPAAPPAESQSEPSHSHEAGAEHMHHPEPVHHGATERADETHAGVPHPM